MEVEPAIVDGTRSRTSTALFPSTEDCSSTMTVIKMIGNHPIVFCWFLHWLSCVSRIEKGARGSDPVEQNLTVCSIRQKGSCSDEQALSCIGRESNPGLAESSDAVIHQMATANFTTKPPMRWRRQCAIVLCPLHNVRVELDPKGTERGLMIRCC
jgi:hypothetical protein